MNKDDLRITEQHVDNHIKYVYTLTVLIVMVIVAVVTMAI